MGYFVVVMNDRGDDGYAIGPVKTIAEARLKAIDVRRKKIPYGGVV